MSDATGNGETRFRGQLAKPGLLGPLTPIESCRLAVVMPVRNEALAIERCLDAIRGSSRRPDEVIVVDAGSTDGTRDIVDRASRLDPSIRLVDNPGRTIPKALNLGWQVATSDVVVRVDGHAQVDPDYIQRAELHLKSGQWHGVGGQKVPFAPSRIGRVVAAAMGSRWGVGGSRYHYAATPEPADHVPFGAYRRETIAALGGWDEDLLVNQDFEFDYRLRQSGGRLLLDPSMRTRWACSRSLRDLAHQYRRYGRGKARVALKHPRSLSLRHVLPPIVVLGLMVLVVGLATPVSLLAAACLVLYLIGAGLSAVIGCAAKLPLRERMIFPVVVLTMHNSWGLGMLQGLLEAAVLRRPADPYRFRRLSVADEEAARDRAEPDGGGG